MNIKGQSLEAWQKWLVSELTPPIAKFASSQEGKYALEGFLELIEATTGKKIPIPKSAKALPRVISDNWSDNSEDEDDRGLDEGNWSDFGNN